MPENYSPVLEVHGEVLPKPSNPDHISNTKKQFLLISSPDLVLAVSRKSKILQQLKINLIAHRFSAKNIIFSRLIKQNVYLIPDQIGT